MRTAELQDRLRWLGFDPGPSDSIYGELTEEAIFDCLDKFTPPPPVQTGLIPTSWLPPCEMVRVICHWTAGTSKASEHDRQFYHILIEDDGNLVRGVYSIADNVSTADGRYAAHTKNCNGGSIGVALCGMSGAIEDPFDAGAYPLTAWQWDVLAKVVAEMCQEYSISVGPETVLSHAEVQGNLGIAQSGKWDFTQLPFAPDLSGATACGDDLRGEVLAKLY